MWKPSRRGWYLTAALAVLVIVGVVGGVYLKGRANLDPAAMVSYLPDRDASYFFADLEAIRNSGVLDMIAGSGVAEEAEYKTFVEQTGFNYKRDLNRIAGSFANDIAYLLLEGRWDWTQLRDHVRKQGGVCKDDYCFVKSSTPERIISFRQLRSNLMGLASAPSESACLAIARRPVRKLPFDVPAQPVWLSLPASALRVQRNLPSGTKLFLKALENADRVLLTLGPQGSDFEIAMDVLSAREEDAVVLKHQLEGLTKLLRSFIAREKQSPNRDDLSGVLTSGTFDRTAEHVKGRWTVTRAFLQNLGKS